MPSVRNFIHYIFYLTLQLHTPFVYASGECYRLHRVPVTQAVTPFIHTFESDYNITFDYTK